MFLFGNALEYVVLRIVSRAAMSAIVASSLLVTTTASFADDNHAGWNGGYLGLQVGSGAVVNEIGFGPVSFNGIGGEGLTFGTLAGWNFQVGNNFVLGIQGDVSWTDLETSLTAFLSAKPEYIASLSGRVGWIAHPDTLVYLIGGLSWTDYEVNFPGAQFSQSYSGAHIGGGIESRLTEQLSARLEYRYTQFDGENWTLPGFDVEPSIHSANLALVWNFTDNNDGDDAPAEHNHIGADWSGPFLGLRAGAGGMSSEISAFGGSFNGIGGEGEIFGLIAGWNFQVGEKVVLGIEGGYDVTGIETEFTVAPFLFFPPFAATIEREYVTSVSARAGWLANPDTLLYVLAGYSWSEATVSLFGFSFSQDYEGGHVGAGVEARIDKSLSARIEYRYTQFGAESFGLPFVSFEPSFHTGTAALVWNLNQD